jgi:hypothetical protein
MHGNISFCNFSNQHLPSIFYEPGMMIMTYSLKVCCKVSIIDPCSQVSNLKVRRRLNDFHKVTQLEGSRSTELDFYSALKHLSVSFHLKQVLFLQILFCGSSTESITPIILHLWLERYSKYIFTDIKLILLRFFLFLYHPHTHLLHQFLFYCCLKTGCSSLSSILYIHLVLFHSNRIR